MEDKMSRARDMYVVEERCTQSFVRNPEGKRPLGIPGCRWRTIFKWIFKKRMGWRGLD
jgi:hypothetical protein